MGIKKRAANRGPAPIKPKKSAALGLIQPKIITTQPFDQLEAAAQKSHTTTMNDLRQFYNAALFAQEQAELKLAQENKDHQATKKHLNKRVEEGKKAAEKVVVQNEELRIKNAQLRRENEKTKMEMASVEKEKVELEKQNAEVEKHVDEALQFIARTQKLLEGKGGIRRGDLIAMPGCSSGGRVVGQVKRELR